MKPRILNTARLSFPLATAIAALLGLFATPAAHAAARTWSGGSGDWQTSVQGGWDAAWTAGDTGIFNGIGGTVTVKSAITTGATALAFTAGNYTLQSDGATVRVVTLGHGTVTLGNGVTNTIGSNVTLSRAGSNTLIFDGSTKATSTLNINSGGKASNSGAAFTIREATANVNTGGTIQTDASLVVGDTTDGATLNVLGGTVTLGTGNAAAIFALGNTGANSPTVNFKITGGSLGFADAGDSLAHSLRVGPQTTGAGVVTAMIDLEGGVVTVRGVYENKSTYSSTLNLHGGTLKALATNSDYLKVDNIWIKSGGAIFDSNGQSVTVTKDLLTDLVSTGGGLTLNDTAATKGTLTLSGASITYTGPTLVSAGKLVVPSTHAGTGAATVSANATLGVMVSGTSQWQPASLSLADPCTLEFNNVQNPGTTTAPLLPETAVGTVTNVTININSLLGMVLINNRYPLVGQVSATSGYTLGTQPAGVTGHLAVDAGTLVYVVDSAAALWTGADGTNPTFWDIATSLNWTGNALIHTPAGSYAEGDHVRFDDTATPASPVTVAIQAAVAPGNMTFANSSAKNYIVSGSFGIAGSGTLTKNGSGSLTLGTDNSYSGVTTVNQGTLSITHNNALGNSAGATTISPTVSGNANLVLNSATADLAVAENLNFISTPTLRARLENTSAFNHTLSGSIHVDSSAAGAITEFNAATAGSINIGGDITGSVGTSSSFLIRGGTVGVGGVINGNITLTGGGGLTKTDNGTWTIGASGKTYSAPIIGVNAGILKMGADNYLAPTTLLSLGNSSGSVGTFDLNGFSQTVAGITNGAGVGQKITSSAGTPVLTVDNPSDYSPANTILTGSLGLTKTGSGTLTLSGNNTYSGGTNVSGNGGLVLQHGSAVGSGTINFASTQTTLAPTFTLSGGIDVTNAIILGADTGRNTIHSLGGDNTLSGNITISNNAANTIAFYNYAAAGTTFTVGGATPNSTTIAAATFSSTISFRCQTSGALGILNSQINAPNATVDANVNGNWTINSTANIWAVTALSSTSILKLGVHDALATGAVVNLNGTGYVDLNGFNQTVAGLAGSGSTGKIVNHSTTSDSILTLAGLTADRNFIGTITDGSNGRITSLVMNSSGRNQTLSGTNTCSGNTTVNAGTLTLSNAPDPLNANIANDASTVTIANTGATLDLTYTGTDKVDKLVIGSAEQVAGIYGKEGSASPIIGIQQITGDGTLTVANGPVGPAGFSSWITGTFANGTVPSGQQGANDDFDKDGISNLIEYAIADQDPTVGNPTVGTFNGGTLSFTKREGTSGLTYDIESSTQLTAGSWAALAKPPVVESMSAISYTFTLGTPVKNFARLKVTQLP